MFDAGKSAGPNCRAQSDCCAENSAEPVVREHKMFDAGKSAGPNCRGAK